MSGNRESSELTRSGDTEGEWVDFPTSSDPDPWAAVLRKADWDAKGAVMTSLAVALRFARYNYRSGNSRLPAAY